MPEPAGTARTLPRHVWNDNPRQNRTGQQHALHRDDLKVGIESHPGQPATHPGEVGRQQDAGILQFEDPVAGKHDRKGEEEQAQRT